jgi:hypothetical protein
VSDPETTEQKLAAVFQLTSIFAQSFLQLTARIDALKAIVCELHPEVASRLEERIRTEQNETVKQFAELLKNIEFLR